MFVLTLIHGELVWRLGAGGCQVAGPVHAGTFEHPGIAEKE